MISGRIIVENKNGIHLRLAGVLVKTATSFKANVMIGKGEDLVNAKSMLGVAGLGAEYGAELQLKIDGEDEREAFDTIEDLFLNRFYVEE